MFVINVRDPTMEAVVGTEQPVVLVSYVTVHLAIALKTPFAPLGSILCQILKLARQNISVVYPSQA